MAQISAIEWTDATWTPIRAKHKATGKVGWHCTHATPGCVHCYAEGLNLRLGTGLPFKPGHAADIEVFLDEAMLMAPLRWKKPRMIFACSMTDLFADFVPDAWIDRIFAVMALTPQHTYQLLTKRSERMRAYLRRHRWHLWSAAGRAIDPQRWQDLPPIMGGDCTPVPNVWLGVSVEDQRRAEERIPDLLATPAAIRFVSAEPLLGPVDFTSLDINCDGEMDSLKPRSWLDEIETWRGSSETWAADFLEWFNLSSMPAGGNMHPTLDWIIVGGESGREARPMHPDWARQIRDQCAAAGTAFFFKQWGEWCPISHMSEEQSDACYFPAPRGRPEATRRERKPNCVLHSDGQRFDGRDCYSFGAFQQGSGAMTMFQIGKSSAGRLLDGVQHDAMPELRNG